LHRIAVSTDLVRKKFQRDMSAEAEVLCFIHDCHPTATQLLYDPIMRNRLTDHDPVILGVDTVTVKHVRHIDLVQFLGYKSIMIKVNDAKTHLSKYLELIERGESVLVCRRNIPIAEIRPVKKSRKTKRAIGLAKGTFRIPTSFFKPLPKGIEDSFYGDKE